MCRQKSSGRVIAWVHDSLTEGAHSGYHRTYNCLAAHYYWPRMNQAIRAYVTSCDVCQKVKYWRQAPIGFLQPLPIPAEPFEVITMDFITELPNNNTFNAILVIVNKLTKYGIFIPMHTTDNAEEVAQLVFQHIISHYGLPCQIISDRDHFWSGIFLEWNLLARNMFFFGNQASPIYCISSTDGWANWKLESDLGDCNKGLYQWKFG